MNKNEICIVIPIYKETLNSFEIQSVEQCTKVLSDYTIHFVCPKGLNIDFYKSNFPTIQHFVFFDKIYFNDIKGYNKLMLNPEFYKYFKRFEYMLIHQTDCYVFRDELLYWASKGYDYVGGIWFEKFIGNPYVDSKLWIAGNGGFSIRKVQSIVKLLSSKKPIKSIKQLVVEKKRIYKNSKVIFIKELFLLPFNICGYQNNFSFKAATHVLNEDFFFVEASSKYEMLQIPKVEDALYFSWDRCPAFLYEKLGQLPFACHAWFREDFPYEENKIYWAKHIKIK